MGRENGEAVLPKTKVYHTYAHSRTDLEHVLDTIKESRGASQSDAGNPDYGVARQALEQAR